MGTGRPFGMPILNADSTWSKVINDKKIRGFGDTVKNAFKGAAARPDMPDQIGSTSGLVRILRALHAQRGAGEVPQALGDVRGHAQHRHQPRGGDEVYGADSDATAQNRIALGTVLAAEHHCDEAIAVAQRARGELQW